MVNNCSLPESIEMKTRFLSSGEGNGSKFWAWVICTGMEIALSAAAAACSHVSDIARRSPKKVTGNKEEWSEWGSDIEGKAVRVTASDGGRRASFNSDVQ